MKRITLLLGLALLACGCGGSENGRPQLVALDSDFVGGNYGFEGTALVHVDRRTLRPYGRRLRLKDAAADYPVGAKHAAVFAPDRRTLAVGGYNFGEIFLVDPERLELRRRLVVVPGFQASGGAEVQVESWPRSDRLVAVTTDSGNEMRAGNPARVLVVDPEAGRVVRRVALATAALDAETLTDGTVAVLATDRRGRFPELVVVSPAGRARTIRLSGIRLRGRDGVRVGGSYFAPVRMPALAADRRRRAFVLAADRPVAEIDLRTAAVRYHRLRLPPAYLAVPPVWIPGSAGPQLFLQRGLDWLGEGRLGIAAFDERPAAVRSGVGIRRLQGRLHVVDTRRWRVSRTVPVHSCRPALGILLCSEEVDGFPPDGKGVRGASLVGYSHDWRPLYRRRSLWWDVVAGRLVAGRADGSALWELDPKSGRRIRNLGRAAVWPLDVIPPAR